MFQIIYKDGEVDYYSPDPHSVKNKMPNEPLGDLKDVLFDFSLN